ncbi:MAG: hypothetical protein IJW31_04255 [Lentisphaeria bacterium]|nr:hypothetical protein [Lentisphaeria bacterium]
MVSVEKIQAVKEAELKLQEFFSANGKEQKFAVKLQSDETKRAFSIYEDDNKVLTFVGTTPAAVFAGAMYYIQHAKFGNLPQLPISKIAPYAERLMTEDFPFHCYEPTGYSFDLDTYAANLAALGFTGMECNRFSREMPLSPFHASYLHTNPSPAAFFKTTYHGNVWSDELIAANHAELERTVNAALKYGLDPIFTIFLPRPYPEEFFELHPTWRGHNFKSQYLTNGGHKNPYALDTDNPEVMDFYRQIFSQMLDDFPQIKHFFFWHSDLGTGFKKTDAEKTMADRIRAFQLMLKEEIDKRNLNISVWVNPWGINVSEFKSIADALPENVGFTIKDNPGLPCYLGSSPDTLHDATIFHAELGKIPQYVREEATRTKRKYCIGQYLDFSEDLDPIVAVPHPVMTYRKFRTLETVECDVSSLHWGLISPDVAPMNINQEVIREMNWGDKSVTFSELLKKILPGALDDADRMVMDQAITEIDHAIRLWPQYWGCRFQDLGIRLGWFLRPFGVDVDELTQNPQWLRDRQIYNMAFTEPYKSFMDITPAQAAEIGKYYLEMAKFIDSAIAKMRGIKTASEVAHKFIERQIIPATVLLGFCRTFGNMFSFFGTRDGNFKDQDYQLKMMKKFVDDEVKNIADLIDTFTKYPNSIIVADKPWGQCFGPDLVEKLEWKREVMSAKG